MGLLLYVWKGEKEWKGGNRLGGSVGGLGLGSKRFRNFKVFAQLARWPVPLSLSRCMRAYIYVVAGSARMAGKLMPSSIYDSFNHLFGLF